MISLVTFHLGNRFLRCSVSNAPCRHLHTCPYHTHQNALALNDLASTPLSATASPPHLSYHLPSFEPASPLFPSHTPLFLSLAFSRSQQTNSHSLSPTSPSPSPILSRKQITALCMLLLSRPLPNPRDNLSTLSHTPSSQRRPASPLQYIQLEETS